jgi:hypothetical protein
MNDPFSRQAGILNYESFRIFDLTYRASGSSYTTNLCCLCALLRGKGKAIYKLVTIKLNMKGYYLYNQKDIFKK